MMYVISECGEIVFPYTFVEDCSGSYHFVQSNVWVSIPDSALYLPSNYHGFEKNDEENRENQKKNSLSSLEKTFSLFHYWYKHMK